MRLKYNLEIANLLKGTHFEEIVQLGTIFEHFAKKFPNQRAGQIITNYICYDYRDTPSELTKEILEYIFPEDPDPFFEESKVTLERLKKYDRSILQSGRYSKVRFS